LSKAKLSRKKKHINHNKVTEIHEILVLQIFPVKTSLLGTVPGPDREGTDSGFECRSVQSTGESANGAVLEPQHMTYVMFSYFGATSMDNSFIATGKLVPKNIKNADG